MIRTGLLIAMLALASVVVLLIIINFILMIRRK